MGISHQPAFTYQGYLEKPAGTPATVKMLNPKVGFGTMVPWPVNVVQARANWEMSVGTFWFGEGE